MITPSTRPVILIIGASRGLGHAMAAEFVKDGWDVVGTVREEGTLLHDLAEHNEGRVRIETLDINAADQLAGLRNRLSEQNFDILFVNAGTTNSDPSQTIGEVAIDDFVHTMITNALSPMRVIESLEGLVTSTGLIGVMSSGQGSITNNETGMREVYRGTKAALNMYMRSFAVRQRDAVGLARALVVMAPGWVRTELGGADAHLSIEDSVPHLVKTLIAKRERPGIEFLDYMGRTVPW
jgi:NAD(P)-dependent dehydrogenase (short-subunit alcohol dehydrogenase family)